MRTLPIGKQDFKVPTTRTDKDGPAAYFITRHLRTLSKYYGMVTFGHAQILKTRSKETSLLRVSSTREMMHIAGYVFIFVRVRQRSGILRGLGRLASANLGRMPTPLSFSC